MPSVRTPKSLTEKVGRSMDAHCARVVSLASGVSRKDSRCSSEKAAVMGLYGEYLLGMKGFWGLYRGLYSQQIALRQKVLLGSNMLCCFCVLAQLADLGRVRSLARLLPRNCPVTTRRRHLSYNAPSCWPFSPYSWPQ